MTSTGIYPPISGYTDGYFSIVRDVYGVKIGGEIKSANKIKTGTYLKTSAENLSIVSYDC